MIYKLDYLSLCPFSRTVILLMNELNLKYELGSEQIYSKITFAYQSNDIKSFSDYPRLIIDNTLEVTGFYGITEYLCDISSEYKKILFGDSAEFTSKCRTIINLLDRELFQNSVKIILYEKIFKNYNNLIDNRSPDSFLLREAEAKIKQSLMHLQSILENSDYLVGEKVSLGDFLLAANISVLDYLNQITWGIHFKRLKHWYSIMKSRTNFKSLISMKIQGFQPTKQYALVDF